MEMPAMTKVLPATVVVVALVLKRTPTRLPRQRLAHAAYGVLRLVLRSIVLAFGAVLRWV